MKSPSDSPNWRNKEVPETTRIMEEVSEEEQPKIKEQQEVLTTTMETPEKELMTNTLEEEPMKLTLTSINVLAQIETDNSPLEELWINAKTKEQSRTVTLYHLYQHYWTSSKAQSTSRNWTSDLDTIMYGSKTVTNGRQHSKPAEDYSNPQ